MNATDKTVKNAYSLQRRHIETIQAHADANFDGNASMALRRIIDEWAANRAAHGQADTGGDPMTTNEMELTHRQLEDALDRAVQDYAAMVSRKEAMQFVVELNGGRQPNPPKVTAPTCGDDLVECAGCGRCAARIQD